MILLGLRGGKVKSSQISSEKLKKMFDNDEDNFYESQDDKDRRFFRSVEVGAVSTLVLLGALFYRTCIRGNENGKVYSPQESSQVIPATEQIDRAEPGDLEKEF